MYTHVKKNNNRLCHFSSALISNLRPSSSSTTCIHEGDARIPRAAAVTPLSFLIISKVLFGLAACHNAHW